MKRKHFCPLALALFLPHSANAFSTTYLASGYAATSLVTLSQTANAIVFDSGGNLITGYHSDNGTGFVNLVRLSQASGYTAGTPYEAFATTANSLNGLDFSSSGTLYASLGNAGGDSGVIYTVQNGGTTVVINLPSYRPTGIDARFAPGQVLFTGRLQSNGSFGNVYSLDSSNNLSTLISGIPLRGIASDAADNIYVSTIENAANIPGGAYAANSIYEFTAASGYQSAALLATFAASGTTPGCNELTFGPGGNLYALVNSQEVVQISAVPEPEEWLSMLSGLGVLGLVMSRRDE